MLKQITNPLLRALFEKHGATTGIPWDELTETQVEPLYVALQSLPEKKCQAIQVVLQDVNDLADERGLAVLVAEVGYRVPERLSELEICEGRADRVLWVYLYVPGAFHEAALFARADALEAGRYWVKRNSLPAQPIDFNNQLRERLQSELSTFFWKEQMRGRYCSIDHYSRANGAEYFFAYLDDYPDAHAVFGDDGQIIRRTDRYAFQTIFVFNPGDGTLDLFARGGNKVYLPLQQAFCRAVLNIDVGPADPMKPAFQLDHLLDPTHVLATASHDRIAEARVTRLRLEARDSFGRYVEIRANPKGAVDDIYQLLSHDLKERAVDPSRVRVRQASFRLEFMRDGIGTAKTLSFNVSCPDSCDLKSKPDDLRAIGERCLKLWRIAS